MSKRQYPTPTRQLHVPHIGWTTCDVRSYWILQEGPKSYLCSCLDDPTGEGKKRRFYKTSTQWQGLTCPYTEKVFLTKQDAFVYALHEIVVARLQCSSDKTTFIERLQDIERREAMWDEAQNAIVDQLRTLEYER